MTLIGVAATYAVPLHYSYTGDGANVKYTYGPSLFFRKKLTHIQIQRTAIKQPGIPGLCYVWYGVGFLYHNPLPDERYILISGIFKNNSQNSKILFFRKKLTHIQI